MNKLVSLVNKWDEFERQFPNSEIEDFCRYILLSEENENRTMDDCITDYGKLLKLISFTTSISDTLFKAAMSKTSLPFPLAFFFLNSIKRRKEVRKTELINEMNVEYSTGMEYLSKLLKEKLIKEKVDSSDKRAKILVITPKGVSLLGACYPYMEKVGIIMFGKSNPVNMKLCIDFLKNTIDTTLPISQDSKQKDFDTLFELYEQ
jgi:DNA-binding MarR family transcriptional regulator